MLRLIQWLLAREGLLRRLGPRMGPLNPFLPEHRRDPHATWRRLRTEHPIFYSRAFGAWVCTRYDDVLSVLHDKHMSADRSGTALFRWISRLTRRDPDLAALIERNLLMLEGPAHRRLRGLVNKAFTPRRVERLRPRVEAVAEELLDRVARRGEMELVADFAHPLPVVVIAELLGVPAADHARFGRWSRDLVQLLDPLQGRGGARPLRRSSRELAAYLRPLLAERRAEPRDDLLSAMISAEEDGERLDERDLVSLCSLILVAGHETTTNLLGNAVLALLRHPQERERLAADPGLMKTAVDEFLRYDGPIQMTDRAALADRWIAGQHVRKGQLVGLVLAAANRDPERFDDPDRLDVGRTDNPHLAFSQGTHYCLGAGLARLEAEVALSALLRRFPDLTGPSEPPAWRRSMVLRGPEAVPLQLSAAGAPRAHAVAHGTPRAAAGG